MVSSSNAPAINDDDIPIKNELSAVTPPPSSTPNASVAISRTSSIRSTKDLNTPDNIASPSPEVSSLNHSHNDSGLSRTSSQQINIGSQPPILQNGEPNEQITVAKSPSTSLEIDISPSNGSIAHQPNQQRNNFSREKLLNNMPNGSIARSLEDVDIQIEDDGCYNPSYTKSEAIVPVATTDDERIMKKSSSLKLRRGNSDSNIQTVL